MGKIHNYYDIYQPRYNITDVEKEYENRINELRVKEGFTLKRLAELTGVVNMQTMWTIAEGYQSPLYCDTRKKYQPKPWAIKLSEVFGVPLEEIFPRDACDIERGKKLCPVTIVSHRPPPNYQTRFVRCRLMFRSMERQTLLKVLNVMSFRHREILRKRYLEDKTLTEIGEERGCTRQRIEQLESKALEKFFNLPHLGLLVKTVMTKDRCPLFRYSEMSLKQKPKFNKTQEGREITRKHLGIWFLRKIGFNWREIDRMLLVGNSNSTYYRSERLKSLH